MVKGNVLVISRTPWFETPRIRHQLSRMLRDIGFEIYFLETIFGSKPKSVPAEQGIHVFRVYEKVHHQLKPFDFLEIYNNYLLRKQIKKLFTGVEFIAVFNFNYDYDFIRDFFRTPIISVINDDFIVSAKPWMKAKVKDRLSRTCIISDSVLSTSYSLDKYLKLLTDRAELFLPWSAKPYCRPTAVVKRDTALYFGYISRIDTRFIDALSEKGIRIRFVGPVLGDGLIVKKKYEKFKNIEFLSSRPLTDVVLDDVCCSIALYDLKNPITLPITASNRMFQLLAEGIPLVYPNLPNLIHAPSTVVTKCLKPEDFVNAVSFFMENFDKVQDDIELFMKEHTFAKRSIFIENLLNRLYFKK